MKVGLWRRPVAAAMLAAAVVAAGCGFGPGESSHGEATLTVTRDYGSEQLVEATVSDPSESETVIRFLDREAEITTRYGGAFVHSIEGLAGEYRDGRSLHWFFYVDGIWSPVGSAEREVRAGHRIWWDYRDWTDAMRVPAVVGSWPEPFAQAGADDPLPVNVECLGTREPCETVVDALAAEGVETSDSAGAETLRLLVGPWASVRADPAAAQLEDGPQHSGVFVRFQHTTDGHDLIGLDDHAEPATTGTGLVAALRDGENPPTWLVTGTNAAGVSAAAELLNAEHLRDRYALLTTGSDVVALPVESSP